MVTLLTVLVLATPLVPTVFAWLRLRRKGYGHWAIAFWFVVSLTASYLIASWMQGDSTSASPTSQGLWIIATPLVWSLLIAGVALRIPHHKVRRVSGQRRSLKPRLFGWSAILIGGVISLFFIVELFDPSSVPRDEGATALLATIAFTICIAGYWLGVDRRVKAAPAVLPQREGLVLYLRAFDSEHLAFVTGHRSVLGRYTNQLKAHVPLLGLARHSRRNTTINLTLEDFVEEAVTTKIGPFVGLGNPRDRLPPDGATREYAPDAVWKDRFIELTRNAKCIVVALAESENLKWELQQIKQNRLGHKLCMLTSPRIVDNEKGSLSTALRSEAARHETLNASWQQSCVTFREAGFECDALCPGPGAAIAFDENDTSFVLTSGACTPDEFVAPIADWFTADKKTGRCVPVSCRTCEVGIYRHNDPPAGEVDLLCFSCQAKAQLASMSSLGRITERFPVLGTLWGIVSLGIAAWLSELLSLKSVWVGVGLWVFIVASPWIVVAGFRRLKRGRLHEPSASASTGAQSPTVANTVATPSDTSGHGASSKPI